MKPGCRFWFQPAHAALVPHTALPCYAAGRVTTGARRVFELPITVQWGHCDPAGIVYFPRFFEWFHQTMEAWFEGGLGVAYQDVIGGQRIGFPAVHTEADFRRPCAFGEKLVVELRLGKIGSSSVELCYRVRGQDDHNDERAVGRTVCVVMDLDERRDTFRRALPIPEALRRALEQFGV